MHHLSAIRRVIKSLGGIENLPQRVAIEGSPTDYFSTRNHKPIQAAQCHSAPDPANRPQTGDRTSLKAIQK